MKKQTTQNLTALLQKTAVQKASVFAAAFLVIGTVSYFGAHMQQGSQAATPPPNALYISPETGSYSNGQTFTAAIRVTTGTEPVNAVQASVTYDPAKLQFVSLAEGTAFPTVAATSTSTPGLVRIARANQTAPVTGDNVLATVTFKMLAASGSTGVNLTIDPAFSYIVRSTDNANIMTSSAGASYSVMHAAPTASSLTPVAGPAAGGNTVTISGSNFRAGATVKFGTTNATSVTVVSPTSIQAVVPAHPSGGKKDVIVANSDGQSATLAGAYTYVAAPTISSITPTSGLAAGGTRVTISGTNFASGITVTIGGVPATSVTIASSTSLSATTGSRAAGKVDVVLRDVYGQTATLAGGYTYVNPAPVVSSIVPNSGYVGGGLAVTITGSNFSSGATVTIGGVAATSVVVVNSSTITARTPARAEGVASVIVANSDGQSGTLTNAFTYRKAGDVNADGRVNVLDLSTLITRDGQNYPPADFNADGTVGSADMAILLAAWTW